MTDKDEPCVISFKLQEGVEYGYPEYRSSEMADHIKDVLIDNSGHPFEEIEEIMNQSEALVFAKKYLEDRKPHVDMYTSQFQEYRAEGFELAMKYVLLDIIPHIYGEALD